MDEDTSIGRGLAAILPLTSPVTWFRLSREQFDGLHYAGMSIFKIGIILFNLVPFVVRSILG